MTTVLYFDCFSGISGDMALGALLDAGLSLDALLAELGKLRLDGWSVAARREMRGYLAGTRALVDAPEQATHRHLADVRAIIEGSALSPAVRERSVRVFTLLAEAEGAVHGVGADAVHFHEVGALDAIIDIVGVVAGLELLGVERVYASPLPLGSGWVRAAHGKLPVPAPAVLSLLAAAGAPTLPDQTSAELVTPTGAALLAALATFERPAMRLARVGYGLGKRELEHPNALRVWFGTADHRPPATDHHTHEIQQPIAESGHQDRVPGDSSLILLETNIDDQPAEQLAYTAARLFELGALDVWQTPIMMKKGRAAVLLAALVPAEHEAAAVTLLMRETTTLGVRRRAVERYVCERAFSTVETPLGAVRVKHKRWGGQELGAQPEYEDCARLACQHAVPLRHIYALVEEHMRGHEPCAPL